MEAGEATQSWSSEPNESLGSWVKIPYGMVKAVGKYCKQWEHMEKNMVNYCNNYGKTMGNYGVCKHKYEIRYIFIHQDVFSGHFQGFMFIPESKTTFSSEFG